MTDRNFIKTFSGLIAALGVLTVVLFILAQMVVSSSNLKKDTNLAQNNAAIAERIKPVGEVTVSSGSGVVDSLIPAAHAADANKGKTTYDNSCGVCHAAGIAGAPKFGDKAAWAPRIAQGTDTLYTHALKGYLGKAGMMPAKGGNMALPDADVKAAVDYMVSKAK